MRRFWFLVSWLAFIDFSYAQAVCTEVKLEIPQQLSMERQAFIARLEIQNDVDLELTEISVTLEFTDALGNPVLASTSPQNSAALFFYRPDEQNNISGGLSGTGTVNGMTSALATWLIVPAAGTGGVSAAGKGYFIGATIRYRQGTEQRTVNVVPDSIVVEPQPKLKLDYFLPEDVFGDDPFTPEPEALVPFTLGVRVKNIGGGKSKRTTIESAQPRIIDNTQGLLVDFQILSGYVQNQERQPTLLLDFGEIDPQRSKMGRWQMTASLTGRFTDLETEFTHDPSAGGALTSLIESVSPHTLIKDVLVNLPGRDQVRDFLARDGDTYRSYESDSVDTEVLNRSDEAQIVFIGNGQYRITLPNSILPSYARVLDPTNGQFQIATAARVGGANLPAENVWSSKRRVGNAIAFTHYINVYDPSGSGSYILTPRLNNQAKIRGEVFRDLNRNGVRDGKEPGIFNAQVSLSGTSSQGGPVSATVHTTTTGAYLFPELLAGTYQVSVAALPGLSDGLAIVGSAGGTSAAGAITNIVLAENVDANGYQFAKLSSSDTPLAELDLRFESLSTSVATGQTVDLTLRLSNLGPDDATGSTQIVLPQGLTVFSATTSNGTYDAGARRWTSSSIVAGANGTLQLVVRADFTGTRTLQAIVTGSIGDPFSDNNRALINITAGSIAGDRLFNDGFEALLGQTKEAFLVGAQPVNAASFDYRYQTPVVPIAPSQTAASQQAQQDGFEESAFGFEE
jgi:uncharacterized repeat protein (TIGR01451 family)